MADADFILDLSGMEEYRLNLLKLQKQLLEISEQIDGIHSDLLNENVIRWHGNGKEQCTAYLALIDRYMSLVAGEPKAITEIKTSASKDRRHSERTDWNHINMLDQSLGSFLDEARCFSFYASPKADCISKLDLLNYSER